jgi:hypothetical protein
LWQPLLVMNPRNLLQDPEESRVVAPLDMSGVMYVPMFSDVSFY